VCSRAATVLFALAASVAAASVSSASPQACTGNPIAYCTGKTNSQGCVPAAGFSGTPTYGTPNDFRVTCSNVLESKNGLLFYGYAPASIPFQGGTICVQGPLRRTDVQTSVGASGCGSNYHYDFDGRIQSGVDPGLVPGASVFCQWWMRDPASPSTTGLSDGLSFQICPGPGPLSISNVTPHSGMQGDLITISGTGFDPSPLNTCVFVGGRGARATVVNASATHLTCRIESVAAIQSGDVEVVSGLGMVMPPLQVTAGSYVANCQQPMALANGYLTGAGVSFALVQDTPNVDRLPFVLGSLNGTLTHNAPAGSKIKVDVHLNFGPGDWKEIVFTLDSVTAATPQQIASAIQDTINLGYAGMGVTAGVSNASIAISAPGMTDKSYGSVTVQ
jgi:hypothetical protein